MQRKKLGRTTLNVSRLCLGTMTFGWTTDEKSAFAIMDYALDHDLNFFDTADIYSKWIEGHVGGESETIIGKWLQSRPRDAVIIATKVRGQMWNGDDGEGLNRQHIIKGVEESLRRLQTDYIDLYQSHWPDEATPIEETLRAYEELVQAGKVRYIGASNYDAEQLSHATDTSLNHELVRYESLQPHYSLLHRSEFETALEKVCLDDEIGVIPYSPLAAGFLTGKYTREDKAASVHSERKKGSLIQSLIEDEQAYLVLDNLQDIATTKNVPVAQIALAWMLANPAVTSPIVGARTLEQLQQTIGATEVELDEDELQQLDTLSSKF